MVTWLSDADALFPEELAHCGDMDLSQTQLW